MGFSNFISIPSQILLVVVLAALTLSGPCTATTRKLNSLYHPQPMSLTYHKGPLLQGNIPISILWYGNFTPPQKSIVSDFLLSLIPTPTRRPLSEGPAVSHWWGLVNTYLKKAGKALSRVQLATQITDENCSLGRLLKKSQVNRLARKVNGRAGGLTLVLTAQDVAVEGFCMSCGFHGVVKGSSSNSKSAFLWVGNSMAQCPGQCAWPFHQPIYGPQAPPLVAPNGDVGVDGMVINIAGLLAGAVTNPFGGGYYLGSAGAEVEAGSACPGVYGKGAYPGNPGAVLVDPTTGASYNAVGVGARKFLLPALFDPLTSQCSTLV